MAFTNAIFVALVSICIVSAALDLSKRKILFKDEFDGYSLNNETWIVQEGHDIYGANRSMCFRNHPDNIKVANGTLIIKAVVKNVMCRYKNKTRKQYTSGRVKTKLPYNFTALEFRGRISKCEHCQPGFWSQKSDNESYEEIDSMEVKGTNTTAYYVNAYYAKDLKSLNRTKSHKIEVKKDLSEDFYTFIVDKKGEQLKFYFDGELKHSMEKSKLKLKDPKWTKTPFSEPQHVIISLLIGGDWFMRDPPLTKKIAREWRKSTLEIDRVVVYG